MSGYVHVYTGNGKGKTTAALGLALRALGAGWRVFIAQFGKNTRTSELAALARFADQLVIRRYAVIDADKRFGAQEPTPSIENGLAECKEALASGEYALVILDEANVAPMLDLFPIEQLLDLIDARADDVELVITGRYAHPQILERADLVTEMREIKHYYRRGILARTGIER